MNRNGGEKYGGGEEDGQKQKLYGLTTKSLEGFLESVGFVPISHVLGDGLTDEKIVDEGGEVEGPHGEYIEINVDETNETIKT